MQLCITTRYSRKSSEAGHVTETSIKNNSAQQTEKSDWLWQLSSPLTTLHLHLVPFTPTWELLLGGCKVMQSRQEVLLLEALLSTEFHPLLFCTHPCSKRGSVTRPPQRLPLKLGSSNATNQALNNYSLHTTASFCMFCMISLAVNEMGDQAAKGQICKHSQVHSFQQNQSRVSLAARRTWKGKAPQAGLAQSNAVVTGRRPCFLGQVSISVQKWGFNALHPEHTAVFQC